MKSRVLIIIITYNAAQWLDRCFPSLEASAVRPDVVVIDNGSSDGSPEIIRQRFPWVNLIVSEKNLGFGGANNIGLRKALDEGYEYVYLLNQDAWIFPDTIGRLIKATDENPEYGILSPLQYAADGRRLDPGFAKVSEKAIANCTGDVAEVEFTMAAHWFMSRHSLVRVGGFSPTFFHYGEDNNFINRLRLYGLKVGVVKEARAVHDRFERPTDRKKRLYLKDVSNLIRLSDPNVPVALSLIKNIFYSIGFSLKERSMMPVKGLLSHLRRFPEISRNRRLSKKECPFL